jgi:starvation-inducible DNA-binding protein
MTQSTSVKASQTWTDLSDQAVSEISDALRQLLADVFSLHMKTKNFHWHMTGRHFRDYHLLLDEDADQIFAMTDEIAERARKIGAATLRSIGDISRRQRLKDNDDENVRPEEMLSELLGDNLHPTGFLREAHGICGKHNDVATMSLIEVWIDQAERRTWFLAEIVREQTLPQESRALSEEDVFGVAIFSGKA